MLYFRKYKLTIQTFRSVNIEIEGDLKITFMVKKEILQIYQWAEITIYNLSAGTETDILQNGESITLEAGYRDGPYGLLFSGPIRQPIRGKEDATTYYLKLVCIDGDDALNLGLCNFTLASGQTAQQIAKQIARSSTVPFDIRVDDLGGQKTQRGGVYVGKPGDLLRDVAKNNNAAFYMEGGAANISSLSKHPPPVVPTLNAQTGMIGFPAQTDQGIRVRTLINPNLKLDGWLKLNNASIIPAQVEFGVPQTLLDLDGLYRIVGITATGDTRGNDWYYDIEAVSQTGSLPAMLMDPSGSGL